MNPVLHQASKEGRAGAAPATRLLNLQLAENAKNNIKPATKPAVT
jgi:hypothetical protein